MRRHGCRQIGRAFCVESVDAHRGYCASVAKPRDQAYDSSACLFPTCGWGGVLEVDNRGTSAPLPSIAAWAAGVGTGAKRPGASRSGSGTAIDGGLQRRIRSSVDRLDECARSGEANAESIRCAAVCADHLKPGRCPRSRPTLPMSVQAGASKGSAKYRVSGDTFHPGTSMILGCRRACPRR